MTATRVGLVALALTSGCLRFGYDANHADAAPDASQHDAGVQVRGGAMRDAAVSSNAGSSAGRASTGAAGSTSASGGAGAAAPTGKDNDAGVDVDQMLGNTGLRVNDILGFYSSPAWGEMVLQTHGDEIWGVYEHDGGTVVGVIEREGVFRGWWSQLPSRQGNDAGEVEFRWSQPDGGTTIHLDGVWRYGTFGAWLSNWDLDLVTDHAPPSALTEAFKRPEDFRRHP